jgi:hypothetical protein
MMKTLIQKASLVLALAIGIGCASDTSTPPSDNFRLQAEMTSSRVSSAATKGGVIQGAGIVTAIDIISMKFLISEIKLQSKSEGTDIMVKDKVALLVADTNGARISSMAVVPAATYNKVSIKFHKLSDKERLELLADSNYADFIGDDRSSVIINGLMTRDGQVVPFQFRARLEETLKYDLADVAVNADGVTVIALQADPAIIFKNNVAVLLDPTDAVNNAAIQAALKVSFKAKKK